MDAPLSNDPIAPKKARDLQHVQRIIPFCLRLQVFRNELELPNTEDY